MGTMDSALADHVDLETAFRLAARLDGVPEQVLRSEHEVKRLRREREQAAEAALAGPGAPVAPSADAGPAPSIMSPSGAAPEAPLPTL